MAQAVEEWYRQMPIITRSYLTAAFVTTIGCTLEVQRVESPDLFNLQGLIFSIMMYSLMCCGVHGLILISSLNLISFFGSL